MGDSVNGASDKPMKLTAACGAGSFRHAVVEGTDTETFARDAIPDDEDEPVEADEWPFGEQPLYRHQEQALEVGRSGRSFVVTTGTGSGKTEIGRSHVSILVPILATRMAGGFGSSRAGVWVPKHGGPAEAATVTEKVTHAARRRATGRDPAQRGLFADEGASCRDVGRNGLPTMRPENPGVGGSIPSLPTIPSRGQRSPRREMR
jgi:hypothetical protein